MNTMSHFDVDFGYHWRTGQVFGKSIRVIDLKELSLLYDLEDWLEEVQVPFKQHQEAEYVLATSPLKIVFYLALISVIKQRGVDYSDRFFEEGCFIEFERLKWKTINGSSKKTHMLDSLQDLVLFAYRRCWTYFKEDLDSLPTNKECFHYFRYIFESVYELIKVGRGRQLRGHIHAKALLSQLMKKDTIRLICRYIN